MIDIGGGICDTPASIDGKLSQAAFGSEGEDNSRLAGG